MFDRDVSVITNCFAKCKDLYSKNAKFIFEIKTKVENIVDKILNGQQN